MTTLRIAMVLDSTTPPAWIARVAHELHSADFVNLAVLALQYPKSDHDFAIGGPEHFLFREYLALDGRRVPRELNPYETTALSDLPIAKLDLKSTDLSSNPEQLWDVVLWFSACEPTDWIFRSSHFGVCSYSHGGRRDARGPSYFWELYEGASVSASRLELHTDRRSPATVLTESFSSIENGWSLAANNTVPHWKAAAMILKGLRKLYQKSPHPLPEGACAGSEKHALTNTRGLPSNAQMLRFLFRNSVRTFRRRLLYSHLEPAWFVAYRTNRKNFVSNTESFTSEGFHEVRAPKGHYFADPFVATCGNQTYIFVEDYCYAKQKGAIAVLRVSENGEIGEAEQVLDRAYHLSYPFVFEHEHELYMIPETFYERRVELYRATDVPLRWELVQVLQDNMAAADTTLWIEDGIFYFFTSVAEGGVTANDHQYLFYSDRLTGTWTSHPSNPIVSDVRRSRSAGHLFRRNGKLIRPAQDCSVRYGYACQLNEVEVLSPSQYREKPISRIEPTWSGQLIGTHTINSNAFLEVIDGQIYGPKL